MRVKHRPAMSGLTRGPTVVEKEESPPIGVRAHIHRKVKVTLAACAASKRSQSARTVSDKKDGRLFVVCWGGSDTLPVHSLLHVVGKWRHFCEVFRILQAKCADDRSVNEGHFVLEGFRRGCALQCRLGTFVSANDVPICTSECAGTI